MADQGILAPGGGGGGGAGGEGFLGFGGGALGPLFFSLLGICINK